MADTSNTAAGATGNSVVDSIFGTLRGIVGFAGDTVGMAATSIERLAAARVALANTKGTPKQLVTTPSTNPNASDVAKIKLWATYVGVSGAVILVGLLVYKKLK